MKIFGNRLNISIAKIGILNGISSFVGILYVVIIARYFGTSRMIEIFFAASLLQQLMVRITQTGQLAEIIIPIYHNVKLNYGEEAAFKTYGVILTWIVIFLLFLSVSVIIGANILVKILIPGFDKESQLVGIYMIRALAPVPVFQVLAIMIGNLANAERYFGWPEFAGLIGRLVNILTILLAQNVFQVWVLVIGLWLSSLTRLFVLISFLAKKIRIYILFSSPHIKFKNVLNRISAATLYTAATQLYLTTLSAAFSYLPRGSYGAFQYAIKLADRLQGVLLRPIGVVYFTEFSENAGKGEMSVRRDLFLNGLKKAVLLAGLLGIPFAVSSHGVIKLIFGVKTAGASIYDVMFAFRIFMLLFLVKPVSLIYRKLIMAFQKAGIYYSYAGLVQLIASTGAYFIIPSLNFNKAVLLVATFNFFLLTIPVVLSLIKVGDTSWFHFLKNIFPILISLVLTFVLITPFADRVYRTANNTWNLLMLNAVFIIFTFFIGSLSIIFYRPQISKK